MQRYLLIVEYIGTLYSGSQIQPCKLSNTTKSIITVQYELERAISTLTKTKIRTVFSGRTDAGVHSRGQTVHFDTDLEIEPCKFVNSLNGILPDTISVKSIEKAESAFHAQRSAKARYYRYTIVNRSQRSAWDRNCLLVKYPLDIEKMNAALGFLTGEHDFTSFKKVRTDNPAKVCKMYKARVSREGDYVYIDFVADRFLYNMVRSIVGTLLLIQRKSLAPETLKDILEARDNKKAGPTVSPEGLTLMEVIYNNIDGESL